MKYFLTTIILIMSISSQAQDQNETKLIYVGDPMCSWCYGFSLEFSKVINDLDEGIQLEIVMGGLRPYNQEKMTDLKSFLTEHWEEVHERSGQEFQYGILDDSSIAYDTEPSCRAVAVMLDIAPEHGWSYFQNVQKAFYYDNKNPQDPKTFIDLASKVEGIDASEFERKFTSQQYKDRVKEHFQMARNLGVSSFPTVVLKNGESYNLIAQGYAETDQVQSQIAKALSQ